MPPLRGVVHAAGTSVPQFLRDIPVSDPTDYDAVVNDVPDKSAYLTLTSCHPEGSAAYRIVVRAAEAEETTVSGLVIPDTAKEKPQQGEVLAVGPGRRSDQTGEIIPIDLSVGDTVVYSKYGGTEITVDGEDLLVLSSRDVLAKLGGGKSTKT